MMREEIVQSKEDKQQSLGEPEDFITPFKRQYNFLLQNEKEAQRLGIELPSSQKKSQHTLRQQLEKLFQIIRQGYEPFQPNFKSFCGTVEDYPSDRYLGRLPATDDARQKFPSGWKKIGLYFPVYRGIIPPLALQRYFKAKHLFGGENIMIYDPDPSHFEGPSVSKDPVLVAHHQLGERHLYFLIATWDLGRDLKFTDKTKNMPKNQDAGNQIYLFSE